MHLLVSILMQMYVFSCYCFHEPGLEVWERQELHSRLTHHGGQSVWNTKLGSCAADHKLKDCDI